MGKLDYLDALKRAMLGLPPDVQAKTLAFYEQRFVDGLAAGRSEEDVGRELDDPRKIAMTLRASSHLASFDEKRPPAHAARVVASAIGLGIFNLIMLVPAMVYTALLFALHLCALAFYIAGIGATAGGLAGTNELVLDWPANYIQLDGDGNAQVDILIGGRGIVVRRDAPERLEPAPHGQVDAKVRIQTDMDAQSRTTQVMAGAGLVLGGILLFLFALVIDRATWLGFMRYVQLNLAMLKG